MKINFTSEGLKGKLVKLETRLITREFQCYSRELTSLKNELKQPSKSSTNQTSNHK